MALYLNQNLFFHWIIPTLRPWITMKDSPDSLPDANKRSFFFDRFDHIVTTARDMLAVRRTIHRLRPDRMIGREVFLIELQDGDEKVFEHDYYT